MPVQIGIPDSKIHQQRIDALIAHYQRADRVLSRQPVRCMTDMSAGFPAWSYKADVFFNPSMISLETEDDYIVLTGLNWHEIAHVMHTPQEDQMSSVLKTVIRSGDVERLAFNILEDQRIEGLMVARWPSMRYYYTATVIRYILGPTGDLSRAFLLTHGRRYLGKELRQILRRKFTWMLARRKAADLINRFRVLNLWIMKDQWEAASIVGEFAQILRDIEPPSNTGHCQELHKPEETKPPGSSQNQKDRRNRKEDTATAIKMMEESEQQEQENGEQESSVDEGEDQEADYSPDTTELDETVEELQKAAQSDKNVRRDMRDAREAVNSRIAMDPDLQWEQTWSTWIPDGTMALATRLTDEMRRVEVDADPFWNTHQSVGRLNLGRAMRGGPLDDDLRDEWVEGGPGGNDIEIVALLDYSGSMMGDKDALNQAAWTTKYAAGSLNITCTVLAFATGSHVLYGPNDRAELNKYPNMKPYGDTYPARTILQARNIFINSNKKKKLFVIMTDGGFCVEVMPAGATPVGVDEFIVQMGRDGILTSMVFYHTSPNYQYRGNWHGCNIRTTIHSMVDFPRFVTDIVEYIMRGGR